MKNILITGVTGFLGWNLAKNLLKDKNSKLYLFARGKGKDRTALVHIKNSIPK